MRIILSMMVLAVAGCASPEAGFEPIALLDPFALTPVDADADPLVDHRPSEVDCPSATWVPEGGSFEIQTGACNYGAFDQPLSTPIAAGDALHIVVWHDTLDFPEPATAHVAVWIGDTVLWQAEAAIPAPSRSFEVTVPMETVPTENAQAPPAPIGPAPAQPRLQQLAIRGGGFTSALRKNLLKWTQAERTLPPVAAEAARKIAAVFTDDMPWLTESA